MKTLITLFLFAGITAPTFSQVVVNLSRDTTIVIPKNQPFNKKQTDVFLKKIPENPTPGLRYQLVYPNTKRSMINHMPNAISVQSFPSANSVYKGSNGEGFDIYGSEMDNMPVLMPDSMNAGMLRLPKIVRRPRG